MNDNVIAYASKARGIAEFIRSGKKIKPFDFCQEKDLISVACTQLKTKTDENFIVKILSSIKCYLVYPKSDCDNTYVKNIIKVFGDKIFFVDEELVNCALGSDIFIFLETDSTIAALLRNEKKLFLGDPYRIGMSNVEAKRYYFENQGFIKYFCKENNIEFQIKSEDDISCIFVGDVLFGDDFQAYTNSQDKCEEQYMLYLQLATKNPKFLKRIREINYLSATFDRDANSASTATRAFVRCIIN